MKKKRLFLSGILIAAIALGCTMWTVRKGDFSQLEQWAQELTVEDVDEFYLCLDLGSIGLEYRPAPEEYEQIVAILNTITADQCFQQERQYQGDPHQMILYGEERWYFRITGGERGEVEIYFDTQEQAERCGMLPNRGAVYVNNLALYEYIGDSLQEKGEIFDRRREKMENITITE